MVVQPGFPRNLAVGDTYSELISLSLPADGSNDDIVLTNTAYGSTLTELNTAPVSCATVCANPGDIVITEIMQNPSAVSDANGEYFEVYNSTSADIDLDGWVIRDDDSDSHTIGSSVIVPAGGYAVLARNGDTGTNGGLTADYVYGTDITLANGDDEVVLECDGTEIDRVNYDGGPNFPDPNGASMNLNPSNLNATDNDTGSNWCESNSSYGDGDLGTPGAANDACGSNSPPTYDLSISDPCTCNNDATVNMSDGTFGETVTVSTTPPTTGLTLLVGDGSTGLIGVSIGDPFTDNGDGTYEISFNHADGAGYTMNVAQDMTSNIIGTVSNTCYYPVPSIDNLDASYCENDPVVNLMGSAQLGDLSGSATAESETWSGPGVTGTNFDPSAAGVGLHTIIYEFDAQDNDPDAQHPGCISSVSQDVEVVDDPNICGASCETSGVYAGPDYTGMCTEGGGFFRRPTAEQEDLTGANELDLILSADGVSMKPRMRNSAGCITENLGLGVGSEFRTFGYPSSVGSELLVERRTAYTFGCVGEFTTVVLDFTTMDDRRPSDLTFRLSDIDNQQDSVQVQVYSGGALVNYTENVLSASSFVRTFGASPSLIVNGTGSSNAPDENVDPNEYLRGAIEFTVDPGIEVDSIVCTHFIGLDRNQTPNGPSFGISHFSWNCLIEDAICQDETLQLTGTPEGGEWTEAMGNPPGANLGPTTDGMADVDFTESGTFEFVYTFDGCTDTTEVLVLDNPEMGITSFAGNPTTPLCAGEQGIYLASQSNVNNDVASYDWTFSSNNSTPVTEPGAGGGGTGQLAADGTPRRIGATWSAAGTETVTLVVTFLNGCSSTTVLNVMINANPDAPIVDDVEVCDGEDTTIEPQAAGGGGGMMTALQEDFEDDIVEYTTSQAECSDGFGDFFIRTDGSDIGGFVNYTAPLGANYFAVMDTDGAPCVESPTSMFFSDIDITGLSNIEFCVYLAEDDDGSNEDWDATDYVHFDYDIDNSGTFNPMIWVENDGSTFNSAPQIDTDFDGDGDGAEITPTFTQYCFSIPATGSELDIEIEFALNAGDEDIAIDEVTVTGEASAVACTFNYYDVDPDANPGSTPIAMGDTYDPMTTVGNSPETYWVTCVDDMTGCESEGTEVTVTVNANPEMGITSFAGNPTTPLCAGEQGVYLSAQSNVNNDVASYDWTFSSNNSTPVTEPGAGGGGTGQLAADGTPRRIGATWSAAGTETVTLVVTFLNGCSSTTVLNVMINANPDAPMVGDVEVCDGEDTTIEPQAAGGGGGMMTALQEDFEDDIVEYTTSQAECSDGSGDFFIRTDGSDIGGFVNYTSPVGVNYFAVMDTDGAPCVESPTSMFFSDIDITGLSNIEFCVYLAEDDDGSNEDWDISDYVHFDYDIDNSGTFEPMIWVESEPDGDAFNAVPKIDTDFDGDGDGAEITPTFTQYCFNITATGSELDIEIEFALNAGDEDIAIDEVTVTGEASAVDCTFNYYDEDPDANPDATPIAMGDTYDPMTTVGNSPESYWVTCVDDMTGCESEGTEVTVTVNALPEAPTADDVVVCEDEKAVIEPEPGAGSTAPMLIASDDFDSPLNLTARENTTDQGTQPDHEDQFTTPGDLFGITDGQSGTPMPRQAPFALVDDAADPSCNGFFAFDNQGVLPCNYGNNYFGVVDTENGENMGSVSADWTFDVSAATAGVSLVCIDMGAMGDFEASDDHEWSIDIDGGGFTEIFMLEADEAATGTYDITNGPVTLNDP